MSNLYNFLVPKWFQAPRPDSIIFYIIRGWRVLGAAAVNFGNTVPLRLYFNTFMCSILERLRTRFRNYDES